MERETDNECVCGSVYAICSLLLSDKINNRRSQSLFRVFLLLSFALFTKIYEASAPHFNCFGSSTLLLSSSQAYTMETLRKVS